VARTDQVQLLYRARLLDAAVEAGPESLEVRLLGWHEIPWADLAFPTVHWILRHAQSLRGRSGPLLTVGNPGGHQPEPLPGDDPLLTAPNLLVVPHVGSATVRTRSRMADLAVDNLLAALAGEEMPNRVA
jgi:hypothetical protein